MSLQTWLGPQSAVPVATHCAMQAIAPAALMVQPGASDREITHAAADAAELAFDRVADAELAHRQSTEGSLSEVSPSYAVSDAVLDQRTYFVPTMVSIRSHMLRCLDV